MEIYFIRHGRSRADDEGKHEGRYDSPLTEVGKDQVKKRALQWKEAGLRFTKIVASPLARAAETARIIGDILDSPVELEEDLMEIDNGDLAGLTYEEAEEKLPYPDFLNPYDRIAHGSGESPWQLHSRGIRALEKVIQLREDRVLVVSHGGTLNAMIRSIVGAQPPVNGHGLYFAFADAGYLHTEYNPDKYQWIIRHFERGYIFDE